MEGREEEAKEVKTEKERELNIKRSNFHSEHTMNIERGIWQPEML